MSSAIPPASVPVEVLTAHAAAAGVVDALLFRRLHTDTWAHLGGLGRGNSWAGIVDVHPERDVHGDRIPETDGGLWRERFGRAVRILGPYYATEAAILRLEPDIVVILGNPTEAITGSNTEIIALAREINGSITDVLPSKRLADELEVVHTVRELLNAPSDGGVEQVLQHLVDTTARALSCEIGIIGGGQGRIAVHVAAGETPGSAAHWHTVYNEISRLARDQLGPADADNPAATGLWAVQDLTEIEAGRLPELIPDARSLLVVAMPAPLSSLLAVIHTDANPRGFSGQCRTLAEQIAATGTTVAHTALRHTALEQSAARSHLEARTDPLTGLGNRLAWNEALVAAQQRLDTDPDARFSIITVDLDGLKYVNDTFGHPAGDDLLRRCADIIRSYCSARDVPVRMGGDEFAVLIPIRADPDGESFTSFRHELSQLRPSRARVAASVGIGYANPGEQLADAFRDADEQMYEHKRARRQQWDEASKP